MIIVFYGAVMCWLSLSSHLSKENFMKSSLNYWLYSQETQFAFFALTRNCEYLRSKEK